MTVVNLTQGIFVLNPNQNLDHGKVRAEIDHFGGCSIWRTDLNQFQFIENTTRKAEGSSKEGLV